MTRIFALFLIILCTSCSNTALYISNFSSDNKVAIFYSARDTQSKDLINYVLNYANKQKLDVHFLTVDVSPEDFSYINKLRDLTKSGYSAIISTLAEDDAKELDKQLSHFNFVLFSSNKELYNYRDFIDVSNLVVINTALENNINRHYALATSKSISTDSKNLYKILDLMNILVKNGHKYSCSNFHLEIK